MGRAGGRLWGVCPFLGSTCQCLLGVLPVTSASLLSPRGVSLAPLWRTFKGRVRHTQTCPVPGSEGIPPGISSPPYPHPARDLNLSLWAPLVSWEGGCKQKGCWSQKRSVQALTLVYQRPGDGEAVPAQALASPTVEVIWEM